MLLVRPSPSTLLCSSAASPSLGCSRVLSTAPSEPARRLAQAREYAAKAKETSAELKKRYAEVKEKLNADETHVELKELEEARAESF